jgi:hypothetical protein
MVQVRSWQAGAWVGLTVTAGLISWQAVALALTALAISGALQLLTEWQRRQTIKALMAVVVNGTTVVMSESREGYSLSVSPSAASSRSPIART